MLEREVWQRAVDGVEENQVTSGKVVASVRRYSFTLLALPPRTHAPEPDAQAALRIVLGILADLEHTGTHAHAPRPAAILTELANSFPDAANDASITRPGSSGHARPAHGSARAYDILAHLI